METFSKLLPLRSASYQRRGNNHTKGCEISPDNLCVLVNQPSSMVKLYEVHSKGELSDEWSPCFTIKEAELIYDFCWYPKMRSDCPETCFFVVTSREQPIHVYDAFQGNVVATFKCINHLDELSSCRSLSISPKDFLYVGLMNQVMIFDLNKPGRQKETKELFNRKKRPEEASGIVSTIATSNSTLYAIGTFSGSVALYDDRCKSSIFEEFGFTFTHFGDKSSSFGLNNVSNDCELLFHNSDQKKRGVTGIKFSPDDKYLVAGGRKDNSLTVFDLRNVGQILYDLPRFVNTNQNIQFDFHPKHPHVLVTGNTNNSITFYDLTSNDTTLKCVNMTLDETVTCVNGLSVSANGEMIACSTGQRVLKSDDDTESNQSISGAPESSLRLFGFLKDGKNVL